jgi:hypothetical protein
MTKIFMVGRPEGARGISHFLEAVSYMILINQGFVQIVYLCSTNVVILCIGAKKIRPGATVSRPFIKRFLPSLHDFCPKHMIIEVLCIVAQSYRFLSFSQPVSLLSEILHYPNFQTASLGAAVHFYKKESTR